MDTIDGMVLGQRIRHYRKQRAFTLEDMGGMVGKPAPYLSMVENGKREPSLGLINDLAAALEVSAGDLLAAEAPTRRAELEVAIERIQDEPAYLAFGLPYLKPSARVPDAALEHIVRLHDELVGKVDAEPFTREAAQTVNAQLRSEMRDRGNYFAEIESVAADAAAAVGDRGDGGMSKGDLNALAAHFGFKVLRTHDVPATARSVTDLVNRRIYVPGRDDFEPELGRSVVLQTLGHFALGHDEPASFADFLRQRVESNYFAGAVLIPESAGVPFLNDAKAQRDLSVEDLKDHFNVSYEMAGHRFTNLATRHLDLEAHFVRSDEAGIIWKAYENDSVPFPQNVAGGIEGERLCRVWASRQAFTSDSRYTIHYQYTDTAEGTYWCATFVEDEAGPPTAVTTGVRFEDAKWFRGWDTPRHTVSYCPSGSCCSPSADRVERWEGRVWSSVRPNSHVLAAMASETIPSVDPVEVYEFLDRHAAEIFG